MAAHDPTRRSFLSRAGALALGGGVLWLGWRHLRWPEPTVAFQGGGASSGPIPLPRPGDRLLLLEGTVNGRTAPMLVDSGAQYTVVDRAFAEQVGLEPALAPPVVAWGLTGGPSVGRAARLDAEVGPMRLQGLRAAVLDLSAVSAFGGRAFPVILGRDVLGAVTADLDFPRRRVVFHRPEAFVWPAAASTVAVRSGPAGLFAAVTVEGRGPVEALVDTGASTALALSEATARETGLLDGRRVRTAPSVSLGGISADRLVRAERVGFAGRTFEDVTVQIYVPPSAPGVPQALVGVGLLERFRVLLDVGAGRLGLIGATAGDAS
ncbi:MAG TPA: retroviral-like aspartic protease family protein [Caulobacteraceae bacterium]|nr:retroviral-like aspartic protease family protein [Caulobacteraceae bacterium]